jgi:hypothetical protein
MSKCFSPNCSNIIENGLWCDKCINEIDEFILCMFNPPSFFYRFYDFIATKIDNLIFTIEHIIDKKKVRKKIIKKFYKRGEKS